MMYMGILISIKENPLVPTYKVLAYLLIIIIRECNSTPIVPARVLFL